MPRELPDRPDLEHLKKQAKALLRELRQRDANASLSDALHALARGYGFASWPKLKAHVDATPSRPLPADSLSPSPLFPRFTEAARRTLFFSRYEAVTLGRLEIAPEHVLLGVIRGAGAATRVMLETAGITLNDARAAIAADTAARDAAVEPVRVPVQAFAQTLFAMAGDEADHLGHQKISTVHIVLALLRDGGVGSSFLRDRGVTLDRVRAAASSGGSAERHDEDD